MKEDKTKTNEAVKAEEVKAPASKADDAEAIKAAIIKEAVAEAKAEAAKIIAEAKDDKTTTRTSTKPTKDEKEAEEKVKSTLFYDGDKYKDDVIVILNGQSWQIKRGVEVELPKKVWDVVKLSDSQIASAATMRDGLKEAYRQARGQLE